MRLFPVRSVAILALVIAPVVASAQGTEPPPPGGPPPAGGPAAPGGAGGGTAPRDDAKATPPADAKSTGNIGGVSFNDKPRRQTTARVPIRHVGGPLATFPGFEQLNDGGTRFFVHVSQNVAVEERKAQGSISYVLRGAHLRVNNDANALVTVHFNTPVFRARLTQQGNDLVFVLELRAAATPTFKISENTDKTATLQVDFAKGDFLTGNETLPAEVRTPSRRGGRGKGRGAQGRPAQQQQPADDSGNGDSGPNP